MSEQKHTRVAIVSDQAIYLRGLASLVMSLEAFKLVGEARSGAECIQLCRLSEPDLVMLDLSSGTDHGREIACHINEKWPYIRVVLLQGFVNDEAVQVGCEEKSLYVISRDASEEEFKSAFQQILNRPLPRADAPAMAEAVFRHHAEEDSEGELQEALDLPAVAPFHRNEELMARELVMAGKIQEDILPERAPTIPGWDISAKLKPARETSGDFYDFIPLTEHKWGVVLGDVTDKGMGAALFMALSSTLIRTYASRFPTLPALALNAVSERLLTDTRGGMYVTAIFGILEPHTGRFIYANAGHPPGILIGTQRGKISVDQLRGTGMALGVSEQAQWKQKIVKMAPGDYLVLYSDGITEAQNRQGIFFDEDRVLDCVLSKIGRSAREMQDALIEEVNRFEGYVPQQDDMALIVIRREPE
jgi:serine phosphatase RsbU (regulator of sigma subunit)